MRIAVLIVRRTDANRLSPTVEASIRAETDAGHADDFSAIGCPWFRHRAHPPELRDMRDRHLHSITFVLPPEPRHRRDPGWSCDQHERNHRLLRHDSLVSHRQHARLITTAPSLAIRR